MKYFFYLALITHSLLFAQADSLFTRAALAYEQQNYQEALTNYLAVEELNYQSSDLFYNTANCYYKLNQIAPAVLYYEKALKLSPNDEDAMFNLSIVKLQLVDKLAQVPLPMHLRWLNKIVSLVSINTWAYITVLFISLFSILIISLFFFNKVMLKKRLLRLGFIALIISGFSYSFSKYAEKNIKTEAILMVQNAYIKSAPSYQSKDLFILHEGTKVQLIDSFNEWSKIKLSDGMIGWLETKFVERI